MKTAARHEATTMSRQRSLVLGAIVVGTALGGGAWLAYLLATGVDTRPAALAATLLIACQVLTVGLFPLPIGPRVKTTVTTAPLFAGALILEPANAAAAAVIGSAAYLVLLRWAPGGLRIPWFKFPFNLAEAAISTGGASFIFHVLGGDMRGSIVAAVPAAMAMYALNTGLVATVASVHDGRSLPRLWWLGTLANGPTEAGLFAFGLLGAVAFTSNPILAVLGVGVPVAVLYLSFSRLTSANGQLEQAMADLKEIEGRMVSSSKLASVGALSLDLAHQVRNPLFIVLARLERVRDRLPADHALRPDIERALEGATRIQQMTDNLVAMARLQWVAVDVATVVEDAVGMAVSPHQVHRPSVERTLDRDLPKVQGNPVLLREVLSNLVVNALEASSEGSPVAVKAASQNGSVVIEVEDHGVGIAVEKLNRLFEPFQTNKPNGLGLGLFSAKHILGMHGGSLEVRSREGQGTVVTVRLPAIHSPA